MAVLLSLAGALPGVPQRAAAALPSGFQDQVVFTGLIQPTAVAFASDGRVFVAEKRGLIKVYSSLTDTTPSVFADLRTEVYNLWDRGLLGVALDPNFPASPYVYALYTRDALPGGSAPHWGQAGQSDDPCPSPPDPTTDGCVATGRLVRLTATGDVATATLTLVDGWCQQFPSHSMGQIVFGPDGQLYASAGEGANYNAVDYGQFGGTLPNTPTLANPCGDPPTSPGTPATPPTAEGGALRSQDLQTSGDPVGLSGSVIRVNPSTGAASVGNPLAGSADLNARRIVVYGGRNSFRFTFRPGTSELWIGDVGLTAFDEIDRITNPTAAVHNMGWPCYEGPAQQAAYTNAGLNICTNLYAQGPGAVVAPYFAYAYNSKIVPGETCPSGGSAIAGVAFKQGTAFPAAYDGALFFADYARNCIWAMHAGGNGLPDPNQIETFAAPAANPVQLVFGPSGDLFYVDFTGGEVHRISYFSSDQPPIAVVSATPTSGPTPLSVQFDASGSSDADPGDTISYDWDFNGDGTFGDAATVNPTHVYASPGTFPAKLKVTDSQGMSDTDTITISAGNSPPVPVIDTPLSGAHWKVGDPLAISGHATDAQDGSIPGASLHWDVLLHHCPSICHIHDFTSFNGASASLTAPDHEYPAFLELKLTATDSQGLSASVSRQLDPSTVQLTLQSIPTGRTLTIGTVTAAAPFATTVIAGSANSVSAPGQQAGGFTYTFSSWSDGKAQTHVIKAPNTNATYTATFSTVPAPVTFKQGTHTGYQFNASGAVTASKTFTLPNNSSAAATARAGIANQSGTWLAIGGGVWAGYWLRESSVLYRTATPIILPAAPNATFSPAVSLSFKQGTHTGYQFNASGVVTASKTVTLASSSSALTSARSTIANQAGTWFLVSSGVWAGYWVRSSDVVYLL